MLQICDTCKIVSPAPDFPSTGATARCDCSEDLIAGKRNERNPENLGGEAVANESWESLEGSARFAGYGCSSRKEPWPARQANEEHRGAGFWAYLDEFKLCC